MTPRETLLSMGDMMMPIRFVCPQCGRSGRLPDGIRGTKIKCPACKTISRLDGDGIAGSNVAGDSSPDEKAVTFSSVRQPVPGGDAYDVEEPEPRPEIVAPPRNLAALPTPKEARKESRKKENPFVKPVALIAGAAVAGAVFATGLVVFLLRPSRVADQPAVAQVREARVNAAPAQGPGASPQPAVAAELGAGQVVSVADLESDQGNIQPDATRPSVAGAAPGRGPRGARPEAHALGHARAAAGGEVPRGESPAKAIAAVVANQGSNGAADTIEKVQAATVYLKVQAGRTMGSGTGFVIRSDDNTVLVATNDHVANPHLEGVPRDDDSSRPQPQPTIVAVFRSGVGPGAEQSLPARILAADGDENRDLAILEVHGVKNPPEPIAMSDAAVPTLLMPLLIYGFPFGNIDMSLNKAVHRNPSITVNRGAVSSMRNDQFNRLARIQIDGSINPGNSGGPVVDEKGRLVGISVAKIANTNIGFAIPVAELTRMLDGRVGALSMAMRGEHTGQADLQVRVRLIDPLNRIKSVDFLYAPRSVGNGATGPDSDGSWAPLPGRRRSNCIATERPHRQRSRHPSNRHVTVA